MPALGALEPDIADVGMDTLAECINALPGLNAWRPFYGPLAVSVGALPTACKGIVYVQLNSGSYDTYVGTATKLYKYNSTTFDFDDVSRTSGGNYNLPSDDFWSFTQFGNNLIACQLGDVPQFIDINSGTNFAALGGSPPTARLCTVMDDKLILISTTADPRGIQWSDIDDPEEWSLGLAGSQSFPDHGAVMGFLAHARLLICERGVRSIVSTGDTFSFAFPEFSYEKGTTSPWSIIEVGREAYWWTPEGFTQGNAEGFINLADGRIAQYFNDLLNHERHFQIFGFYDPYSRRIGWAFPTGDTEYNDKIIGLDRGLTSPAGPGRWFYIDVDSYVISRLATAGVTLEGGSDSTDMDEAGLPSLDSRIYMAGAPVLVVVGSDLKLSNFTGDTMEASWETATQQFGDGTQRARVQGVRLVAQGSGVSSITAKVRKRNLSSDNWSTSGAISHQASGNYPMNADGREHRFVFTAPAAAAWTHVQAYRPQFRPTSGR